MNPKRFKVLKNGYKFDKYIFRVVLIALIVLFSLMVFLSGGKNSFYYSCDEVLPCDLTDFKAQFCNLSFFELLKYEGLEDWLLNSGLCNINSVPVGFEYGEKPLKFQGSEFFLTCLVLFSAFFVNHFKYNKDFEFKEEF